METAFEPIPDGSSPEEPGHASVGIVVLAAGRSSRMNGPNKLLATFDGIPLIRRSVETALGSSAVSVHVVLGHMSGEIERALAGLPVRFLHNARYAEGFSTSLVEGFQSVAVEADGVLVMLADQPLLTSGHLDRMISAFQRSGAGSIVLACDAGRPANPVVLSSDFLTEVRKLTGDVGARSIVRANRKFVREVELGPAASLDVDTQEEMTQAGGVLAGRLDQKDEDTTSIL